MSHQIFVFVPSLLLVFLPGQIHDLSVQLLKLLLVLVGLFLHLLASFVTVAREMLHLLDCAVGLGISLAQIIKHRVQFLLLLQQQILSVGLRVQLSLKTT